MSFSINCFQIKLWKPEELIGSHVRYYCANYRSFVKYYHKELIAEGVLLDFSNTEYDGYYEDERIILKLLTPSGSISKRDLSYSGIQRFTFIEVE